MSGGRASDRHDGAARCYLFYGPDEAGSRALAARIVASMGDDIDRVDLAAGAVKSDPALLVDEAASASLFGGRRYIRIDPAGDECVGAVDALLASPSAIHPVILLAGAIKKDSRLVKLVGGHPAGKAVASYAPDAGELARLAQSIASDRGVRLDGDIARRLVEASASDRAILTWEIEKLADYLDAMPAAPKTATDADIDAITALLPDADIGVVVDAVASGDARQLDRALSQLRGDGQDGIAVVRAALRRLLAMAAVRAEMTRGATAKVAVDKAARFLFWKEKDAVSRDIQRWPGDRLDAVIRRLAALERELKSSRGSGAIAVDQLFHAIARSIRR